MLYDAARHEPLALLEWDATAASAMVDRIVREAEDAYVRESGWPMHPLGGDGGPRRPTFDLYSGASGVAWALHHLQSVGAVKLCRTYRDDIDAMLERNRECPASQGDPDADRASYLMGDTGILLAGYALAPRAQTAEQLEHLIARNLDHPARELAWGAPGTMLAALFLHHATGERRWAGLFVASARKLWSQLLWSPEHRCRYWTQDMYGHHTTYLGAVHGFAGTAAAIIAGRSLLDTNEWDAWRDCIAETVRATVQRDGREANWPPMLLPVRPDWRAPTLMQFCHGAPGFITCVADLPAEEVDDHLLAGGEAIWNAGPLAKGSNLCHGTGGNGYAFLKLYGRTGDVRWLERARAFAMHGIAQTQAHAARYGQMRYSLWTGDVGFAIYLRDCIRGSGAFPTLQTFFAAGS